MKKWFGLVLIFALVVVLCSACGKTDVVTGDDVLEEEVEEEIVEEEEIEEVVEEEPEVLGENEEDPLYILSTTWEIANERSGFFLIRGENLYTLNSSYKRNPNINYPSGILRMSGIDPVFYIRNIEQFGDRSLGDIPIPLLENGDKIIAISRLDIPVLRLYPVELGGYSCLLNTTDKAVVLWNVWDKSDMTAIPLDVFDYAEVTDSEGNTYGVFEEGRGINWLEKNQTYTLSWFEGTKRFEKKIVADSRVFYWDYLGDYYEIEGSLTNNGYAEYDVSGVPAGIYRTGIDGGLIEIP